LDGDFGAIPSVADVVVLAEDAGEIAPGQEDRSRTTETHEAAFFAEMRAGGTDEGSASDTAEPTLALRAIDPTLSRADPAGCQQRVRAFDDVGLCRAHVHTCWSNDIPSL